MTSSFDSDTLHFVDVASYHCKKTYEKDPNRFQIQFHCAQSEARQEAHKKKAPLEKQRDKLKMTTFDCGGWLYTTMSLEVPHIVALRFVHKLDHVPYWNIHLPADIRAKIHEEATEKTVSQVRVIPLIHLPISISNRFGRNSCGSTHPSGRLSHARLFMPHGRMRTVNNGD